MAAARSNRWQPPALDASTFWPKRDAPLDRGAFKAALAASAPRKRQSPTLAPRRRVGLPARDSGPNVALALPAIVAAMGDLLDLVGRPEVCTPETRLVRGRTLIEVHESAAGTTLYLHYGCRPDLADERDMVERAGEALERVLNLAGIRTSLRSVLINPVLRGVIPRGLTVALRLQGRSAGAQR